MQPNTIFLRARDIPKKINRSGWRRHGSRFLERHPLSFLASCACAWVRRNAMAARFKTNTSSQVLLEHL